MSTKFMEQTVLETMPRKMGNKEVTGDSTSKGKLFLTNLVAFYDGIVDLVNKGKAMDVIHLDLSKEFCQIFSKLEICEFTFDGLTSWWIRNQLDGHFQRVVVNGSMSKQRSVMNVCVS